WCAHAALGPRRSWPVFCSPSCGSPICGTSLHRPNFRRDHVFQGKLPASTGSGNNRSTTVAAPGVDRLCMTTEGRARTAAQKPRTGDGPLEVTEEGRSMVMRLPVEGGGRLVIELSKDEATGLHATLAETLGL